MRILQKKLNNNGSTLLMVIICLAFLSILGALMLSVSTTNLQMKIIESKSKENFYSCEIAVDEIRVGLQELTAETIKEIYNTEVLPKYAIYTTMTKQEKNNSIQKFVVEKLILKLGVPADTADKTSTELINATMIESEDGEFTKYLSAAAVGVRTPTIGYLSSSSTLTESSITIENIKIIYSLNDYETSITTDLHIDVPEFSFSEGVEEVQYNMTQPFEKYALIADGGIISDSTASTSILESSSIIGSIYAGEGGITIKNGISVIKNELLIKAENIVTRGNISVIDTGTLTIVPRDGSIVKPIIWADNLVTQTTSLYPYNSLLKTTMDMNGIFIIKDDLLLDGRNSDVKLEGAYIGYTGTHTARGSAVMINGPSSSLDLSGLNRLILAGRAHVSVKDNILSEITDIKYTEILTGESVAFKSNQRAYLVPGKFIEGILHNPVSQTDVNLGAPIINIADDSIINYLNYVATIPLSPFKIAAKQVVENDMATTLRYYYLNFGSGKQADEYLKIFMNKYPGELNILEPFTLGSVVLPSSGVSAAGNLMSYDMVNVVRTDGMSFTNTDDTNLDNNIAGTILTEDVYLNTGLQGGKTVSQMEDLYARMTHLLSIDNLTKPYREDAKVTDTYLITGGVKNVVDGVDFPLVNDDFEYIEANSNYTFSNGDPLKKSFIVIDGDVLIQSGSRLNGILIASGDINIASGAIIHGLVISVGEYGKEGNVIVNDNVQLFGRIVAGNNISLGKGCTIETNAIEEAFLAQIFTSEGYILNKVIKNTDMTINFTSSTIGTSLVDFNIISYENWRKD